MASPSSSCGVTWSHKEILALIRIWCDQNSLNKSKRHTETYKKLTDELMQAGCSRTKKQVTDKIKTLCQFYKDIEDSHKRSDYDLALF